MATKSTNTQGNPYHDDETGEFTSPDSASSKTEKVEKATEPQISKTFSRFKLKGNVEDVRHNLQKSTQLSSIPIFELIHISYVRAFPHSLSV